jgi:hypothetical protein
MEQLDQIVGVIALTMGVAWASGINLYAALFLLGALGATGNIGLPPDLQILAAPPVIAAAGIMYLVEFFADKVPGVDTGWDAIHTFIRIPAGALLAAGAVGDVSAPLATLLERSWTAMLAGCCSTFCAHPASRNAAITVKSKLRMCFIGKPPFFVVICPGYCFLNRPEPHAPANFPFV